MAQRSGGRFLVRIEDIDVGRAREAFTRGVFEDLAWLGVAWEEPVRVQSQHFDDFRAAAGRLRALGVLYPCFATRTEIAGAADPAHTDPDGTPLYTGVSKVLPQETIARRLAAGEPHTWRIDMAKALARVFEITGGADLTFAELSQDGDPVAIPAAPQRWGDAVIVRKDVPASYHLAVVVDDALQGVTHVTRGRDLFAATGLHRVLQVLLGLPAPVYFHHRLIADATGRKLAKSAGDPSLADLRSQGVSAEAVRAMLAPALAALPQVGDRVRVRD